MKYREVINEKLSSSFKNKIEKYVEYVIGKKITKSKLDVIYSMFSHNDEENWQSKVEDGLMALGYK